MFISKFQEILLPILEKKWYLFIVISFIFFITKLDFHSGFYFCHSLFLILGLIGFSYKFPRLSIPIDISYGLFLYHMIVINMFVDWGLENSWLNALIALIISCFLAFVSTNTIGRYSKLMKN